MIRVRVADAIALAARTPAELSMYLRATGWRPEGHDGTLARWTRSSAGDEGDFEIIQPLDPASRDYAARVGDAVATLAVAEDRSELGEVTVNGNLVRRGTRYVLTQPSGFRIPRRSLRLTGGSWRAGTSSQRLVVVSGPIGPGRVRDHWLPVSVGP